MTKLDDSLLPAVLKLINDLGTPMTYEIKSGGSYDPTTRSVSGETTSTYSDIKSAPPFEYEQRYIDGDLIKQGDLKTIIAGKDSVFTPEINMKVTHKSNIYKCKNVSPLYSGDSIAAWIIQLRNNNG